MAPEPSVSFQPKSGVKRPDNSQHHLISDVESAVCDVTKGVGHWKLLGSMTASPARCLLHNHNDFHSSKSRVKSNKVKEVAFFCQEGVNRGVNTPRSTT